MSIDDHLGSRKDAHYAVVVGIDKYVEEDILKPLSGVVGDVAASSVGFFEEMEEGLTKKTSG